MKLNLSETKIYTHISTLNQRKLIIAAYIIKKEHTTVFLEATQSQVSLSFTDKSETKKRRIKIKNRNNRHN